MAKKRSTTASDVRARAHQMLTENLDEVISGLIAAAEKGNWQAAKFLFDISGALAAPEEGAENVSAATLVQDLCDQLKLASAEISSPGTHSTAS